MFYFKGDKDKHAFCRPEEPIDNNYEDSSAAKHVINLLIYFVF